MRPSVALSESAAWEASAGHDSATGPLPRKKRFLAKAITKSRKDQRRQLAPDVVSVLAFPVFSDTRSIHKSRPSVGPWGVVVWPGLTS